MLRSRADIEEAFGGPLPANVIPVCSHCAECPGADEGPTIEDADQRLWLAVQSGGR
jgi:hypothetical protein